MRLTRVTWRRTLRPVIVSLLLLCPGINAGSLNDIDAEIRSLLSRANPSVVTIHTYRSSSPRAGSGSLPFQRQLVDTLIGTGVVYTNEGHVVSTRHVVSGGSRFEIFSNQGKKYQAVLVGSDPDIDVSVLQMAAGQLPALPLDDARPVQAGSLLFVIGNSFGIPNAANIATAVGYRTDGTLQISAGLAPGFSGGPVISLAGKMVGLVSAKLTEPVNLSSMRLYRQSAEGVKTWGFSGAQMELPSTGVVVAISAADMKNAADRLISGEQQSRGFLGVQPQDVDPEWLARAFNVQHGVMIANVLDNSPAWNAGIRAGDILTLYLGRRISSSEQLSKLIAANRPGDVVSLAVVRANRNLSFTVQLSSRDAVIPGGRIHQSPGSMDTVYEDPESELPLDDSYKDRLEQRIRQLRRDLLKQMNELENIRKELERLGKRNQ